MGMGMSRYSQQQLMGFERVENTVLAPASRIVGRVLQLQQQSAATYGQLEEIKKEVIELREWVIELSKYPWAR